MSKRFSSNELYELRNKVPINTLIEKILMVPGKPYSGGYNFKCPHCNNFQTATNPNTNLARCFQCEKNFNPIDMVMVCKKIGFVESVKYLKSINDRMKSDHQYSGSINDRMKSDHQSCERKPSEFLRLKDIFINMGKSM